jgi:ribosomal protein L10
MKRTQKAEVIAELKETLGKSKAGVVTSYQGLPTTEIVNLRHKLRDSKLELKVVKNNTLATLPSQMELVAKVLGGLQSPITGLVQSLSSPIMGIVYAISARIQQMEGK